ASSAALAVLLQEGIGDTIRISLTPEPGAPRTQEVVVAQELLQTMGLRAFTPMVTACPGCGGTTSEIFQDLAKNEREHVRAKMPEWRVTHPGAENLTLAVMGCVVNGPGESRHANIGISLPGTGEAPSAPVFVDGEKTVTLRGDSIASDFVAIIDRYVEAHFGARQPVAEDAGCGRAQRPRGGALRRLVPAPPLGPAPAGVRRHRPPVVGVRRAGRRGPRRRAVPVRRAAVALRPPARGRRPGRRVPA